MQDVIPVMGIIDMEMIFNLPIGELNCESNKSTSVCFWLAFDHGADSHDLIPWFFHASLLSKTCTNLMGCLDCVETLVI